MTPFEDQSPIATSNIKINYREKFVFFHATMTISSFLKIKTVLGKQKKLTVRNERH